MPRDERKHQKALMKKRSKQKAGSSHKSPQEAVMPLSKQTIIHRARSYPVEDCLISSDWERGWCRLFWRGSNLMVLFVLVSTW